MPRPAEEQGAAAEHLHRVGELRGVGELRPLAVERAEGPAERGDQHRDDAEGIEAPRTARPHQQHQAGEAEQQAGDHPPSRLLPAVAEPDHQHDPERLGGDQQRHQPRAHPLLGPDHAAVAGQQQQGADEDRRAPVDEARPGAPRNRLHA